MQDIDLTSPWFAAALSNGTRFEVLQMNTELDHALIVSHTGECLATGTSEEIHALAARIEDAREEALEDLASAQRDYLASN